MRVAVIRRAVCFAGYGGMVYSISTVSGTDRVETPPKHGLQVKHEAACGRFVVQVYSICMLDRTPHPKVLVDLTQSSIKQDSNSNRVTVGTVTVTVNLSRTLL